MIDSSDSVLADEDFDIFRVSKQRNSDGFDYLTVSFWPFDFSNLSVGIPRE